MSGAGEYRFDRKEMILSDPVKVAKGCVKGYLLKYERPDDEIQTKLDQFRTIWFVCLGGGGAYLSKPAFTSPPFLDVRSTIPTNRNTQPASNASFFNFSN